MPWDPDRYHQFQKERALPFEDLWALIHPKTCLRVIDLGCGSGELTQLLAERLPKSRVTGIDSSQPMLERARSSAGAAQFEFGKIEEISGKWDLVFSNAAIQWVDDHEDLIRRLLSLLEHGGQLVVQLPSNHTHPTHTLIGQVAQEEPFRTALGGWVRRSPVLPVGKYAELLFQNGAKDIVAFEKVYPHVLADADALADWTSGTALVPYFERLGLDLSTIFMERYRQRLRETWPGAPVFYPFKRILFSAGID